MATVTVGSSPAGVAYDSAKGEVFVTNEGSNTTSVISDSNNSVVATVNAGNTPDDIGYDSAKGEMFVTNAGGFLSTTPGIVTLISDGSSASNTPTSSSATASSATDATRASGPASSAPTSTSTSPSTATSTSSSSGGSLAIFWNYVGIVAINATLLLILGSLAVRRRKS